MRSPRTTSPTRELPSGWTPARGESPEGARGCCSITTRCGGRRPGPVTSSLTGRASHSMVRTKPTRALSAISRSSIRSVRAGLILRPAVLRTRACGAMTTTLTGRCRETGRITGGFIGAATKPSWPTPSAMRRCWNWLAMKRAVEWASFPARWTLANRAATCSRAFHQRARQRFWSVRARLKSSASRA